MSDSVEHGHKMKRIHERGDGTNSAKVEVGGPGRPWEALGGRNSARDDRTPSHTIRQRKHFYFLNFQLVDKSSQNT